MSDVVIIGPITINLTFLGVAAAIVAAFGIWLRSRNVKRKREHAIAREYSELKDAREVMWTAVRETYQRFRANHTTAPNEIEDLIATVKMPPDVGDRKGSDLILWPVEHAGSLNHDQRLLIVSLVYPPRNDRPGKITDYTFIAAHVAIDFHQARGKLAHFWSRAPRNVDTSHFVRHYQSALPDLVLLSWFDIALKQWTRDPDEGKVFVFKVAHAISAVHH